MTTNRFLAMFRRAVSSGYLLGNTGKQVVTRFNATTMAATQSIPDEWDSAKPYEEIPGPKPLPLVGNIWRFLPYIGDFATEFTEQQDYFYKTYGQIMKITGLPGRRDMVMLFNPDDFEKVFRNEGQWPIRDTLQSISHYRTKTRRDVFDGIGGAIVSQGEEWQKFRTKVNPIMMQPRATKLYVEPIDAVARDFISRIRKVRDDKQEMPEDFANELCKWALESIVYIALDTRLGCLEDNMKSDSDTQKMINAVEDIFHCLYVLDLRMSPWRLISTPTYRKFIKASDYFTEVCMKYITQAMERLKAMPEDSDRELTVLEKLLARDSNPKTAMVMALDMMTAGVDTTSYTTAIALYFLAKNPDKQQKLFEEVKRHLPNVNDTITSDILNNLKYLKACLKESMRMRPIAIGNARTNTKDLVLSGYRIPKGVDVIMPNIYLCNKMDKYFPEPEKYIPERWLKGSEGGRPEAKSSHPFVFLPFGFGPRMCLGRRFAELELETIVTKIIRNFSIEYNYGEMQFQSKLLYVPVSPLKFKFTDRE